MIKFKLNQDAPIDGSSLKGYLHASYSELAAVFGKPLESDGYKVSGEWVFQNAAGFVFTIYDYKETSLYDSSLPSVESFRLRPQVTFHVGSNGSKLDALEFISWIENVLVAARDGGGVDRDGNII